MVGVPWRLDARPDVVTRGQVRSSSMTRNWTLPGSPHPSAEQAICLGESCAKGTHRPLMQRVLRFSRQPLWGVKPDSGSSEPLWPPWWHTHEAGPDLPPWGGFGEQSSPHHRSSRVAVCGVDDVNGGWGGAGDDTAVDTEGDGRR